MGVYGPYLNILAIFQKGCQVLQFAGHEAQAVHAGVKLDMDRIIFYSSVLQYFAEGFQCVEIWNSWFKVIVYDFIEEVSSGSQNQDRKLYSRFAEFHAFHWISYGKVVCTGFFHHRCKLHCAMSVSICLDQNKKLCPVI